VSDDRDQPAELTEEVTGDGVFAVVRDGYDAVYRALLEGDTFGEIWRTHAYRDEFPAELAHIGFLTLTEAARLTALLDLHTGDVLVDVACGGGGPGLWVAAQSGASLIGIDPADAGLTAARRRAHAVGYEDRARFQVGTFERTGLADATADAVMTIEAFQYAPDKRAALAEISRILKPGRRVGIVCFEVDPTTVQGIPVLGVDPVLDYAPLLTDLGFTIEAYEETPGWAERVYPTFAALIDASDQLTAEMGEDAASSILAEAIVTTSAQPYPRRVLIVAQRPHDAAGGR
jgi:ubiquinone/menaquinone biosynthesis C-methylase UbiE